MSGKVDLKVVLLGRQAVGKTALIDRFLHNRWNVNGTTPTVGAAYGVKTLSVLDSRNKPRQLSLGIWDTAGSERYESMTRHYYKNADAAVVCYDVSDAASWEKVKFWVEQVRSVEPQCIIVLVATKIDLVTKTATQAASQHRAVSSDEVHKYAREIGANTFETSSRADINVTAPFESIARDWCQLPTRLDDANKFQLLNNNNQNNQKQKNACCNQ